MIQPNDNDKLIRICQKLMSKKHSTRQTTLKIDVEELIVDIYGLFDSLFVLRLLDKISRPIANIQRLSVIEEYQLKFNDLHYKLDNLRKIGISTTNGFDGVNSQKNQQRSTKVNKPIDFKKQIRKIQSKYVQLFQEGSFKYYDKVAKIYNLPQNFSLVNIQHWATQTLGSMNSKTSLCC